VHVFREKKRKMTCSSLTTEVVEKRRDADFPGERPICYVVLGRKGKNDTFCYLQTRRGKKHNALHLLGLYSGEEKQPLKVVHRENPCSTDGGGKGKKKEPAS